MIWSWLLRLFENGLFVKVLWGELILIMIVLRWIVVVVMVWGDCVVAKDD